MGHLICQSSQNLVNFSILKYIIALSSRQFVPVKFYSGVGPDHLMTFAVKRRVTNIMQYADKIRVKDLKITSGTSSYSKLRRKRYRHFLL